MSKLRIIINMLCLTALAAIVVACKPGVPDDYIQPGEMEDILYDYHVAMAMAQQGDEAHRDERIVEYKEAVLRKYGYTDKQMDASMRYYMRHTDQLHDIYDKLAERLDNEAKDLGANGSGMGMAKTYKQNGDTADVWKGPQAVVLMPEAGQNSYSFAMRCDTAYHVGDTFSMQFDAAYIIQDGTRNAVAVIALTLDNDSVVSQVMRISSDSHQSTFFGGFTANRIKAIRGYILFPPDNGVIPSTTLKILCITNIHFLRMHAPKQQPEQGAQGPGPSAAPAPQGQSPSGMPVSGGGSAPAPAGGAVQMAPQTLREGR